MEPGKDSIERVTLREAVTFGRGHSDPQARSWGETSLIFSPSVLEVLAFVYTGGLRAMQQGEGESGGSKTPGPGSLILGSQDSALS